jgi:hypothetical protein
MRDERIVCIVLDPVVTSVCALSTKSNLVYYTRGVDSVRSSTTTTRPVELRAV